MNNYVELIEALNRITEAVSTHSVLRDFFSTFLATAGSIAAVLAVEAIKEHFFAPRREFKQLRKRVNILLGSYSRFLQTRSIARREIIPWWQGIAAQQNLYVKWQWNLAHLR